MPMLERDGVRVHYEAVGPASSPSILFSHGFSATEAMWSGTVASLAGEYRCITWDLRGHGASDAPDDPERYSPELALEDMEAILDAESVESAVLVGHSLGGYLSLRFEQRSPDRVAALVLVDTGPGYRNEQARAGWNEMCESYARAFDTDGLAGLPSGSPEVAGASHRSAVGLAHAARHILTQHTAVALEHLPAVGVPTLVVVGSEDRPFLGGSEYMARKIPEARQVVIAGAGHAPMLSHPEMFQQELHRFLGELEGS